MPIIVHLPTKQKLPTELKNPYTLTVQTNGTTQATYDGSAAKTVNITPSNIGAAASSHNHTKAQITDFPTTLKNPAALTIQLNGSSQGAYDGGGAKTVNITPSNIGAATSSHTHSLSSLGAASSNHSHSNYSTATNVKDGTGGLSTVEGYECIASGFTSHVEGDRNTASGYVSHASGRFTQAIAPCQTVVGLNNIPTYNFSEGDNTINDLTSLFIVGGGDYDSLKINAFRVARGGRVYTKTGGSYNTSGADYGEFFEWLDGNPNAEDRIGYFVTLEGDKIKIANEGDYILGVVSGISGVIGNSDEHYTHRWKTDEFGRLLTEQKTIQDEVTGEAYITEVNIENEDYVYEQDLQYTHRSERKEWDVVGMLGQIIVRDDGTCKVNHYCIVADGGIATATDDKTGYRVIERITDNIIKIIVR